MNYAVVPGENRKIAADMLAADAPPGTLRAYRPSIDAADSVGSIIVRVLATHWGVYKSAIPEGHR